MISVALNDVFKEAVSYAKENRHEYLTVEHVFLAIVRSEKGREILNVLGANIEKLEKGIIDHIQKTIPVLKEAVEPFETVALSRAINDMMTHIHSAGRTEAKIGDMLASIFLQEHSYAVYLMKREGIARVDVLEVSPISITRPIRSLRVRRRRRHCSISSRWSLSRLPRGVRSILSSDGWMRSTV